MNKSLLRSLIVIALVAVVLLAATFGLQSLAVKNARAEHLRIMRTLLPGSTDFVVEPYTGEDANVRSVHKADNGFVIETATQGYADEVVVLVGVNNDGFVTGIVVKEMHETVGLGILCRQAPEAEGHGQQHHRRQHNDDHRTKKGLIHLAAPPFFTPNRLGAVLRSMSHTRAFIIKMA